MKIDIVLKSTLYSGNIGLIARSAKNFDINRIKLVNPLCSIGKDSIRFASNARDTLSQIEIFPSLAAALKDYHIVFGTTARLGGTRSLSLLTPGEAGEKAREVESSFDKTDDFKLAILFGSEDKGLSNQDLEFCNHLVTIPSSDKHPSLNLSHAVTVFNYEFFKLHNMKPIKKSRQSEPASFEFANQFYTQLEETLDKIGYFKTKNHSHMLNAFKRIGTKALLTHDDITIMRGVLRQLSWYINNHKKETTNEE